MKINKKSIVIISLMVILCIIMAVVDGVVMANYFVKSAIKLVLFIGVPNPVGLQSAWLRPYRER